jgi:DNA ligase (NAD+)
MKRETRPIVIPTNCPCCDSLLELVVDRLFCRNPDCEAQTAKTVEHFAKVMKIKGLGPAAIEKLQLTSIFDIYELTEEEITALLGSEKLAEKLFLEIERSKTKPLNMVLPAFGISLIGQTATDKLSAVCDSIFDIDEDSARRAGLGQVATNNLINWLDNNLEKYVELPLTFDFTRTSGGDKVACISGKLKSFKTKAEAKKVLEELGYTVKDSVTKQTTVLINESGIASDKTKKAESFGIPIITNLNEFIKENN